MECLLRARLWLGGLHTRSFEPQKHLCEEAGDSVVDPTLQVKSVREFKYHCSWLYGYWVAEAGFRCRQLRAKVKPFTPSLNVLAAEFRKEAVNCFPFTAPPFSVHLFIHVNSEAQWAFLAICSVHVVPWRKTPGFCFWVQVEKGR